LRRYPLQFARQCSQLGTPVHDACLSDIETVAQAIASPGLYLVYTHGDVSPGNCLIADNGICLIDFEFGGFRHALIDGQSAGMRFPTSKEVADLPPSLVDEVGLCRDQRARDGQSD
jgi:hypothetical protein